MMEAPDEKWDRIYRESEPGQAPPAQVLGDNEYLLPKSGIALDLACGLGANAVFLARRGLNVTALDLSRVAIDKLVRYAAVRRLPIEARRQHVDSRSLPEAVYDVIVISRFLDRTLSDAIIAALKPEGLLFYQTYTREKQAGLGPNNPEFLLGVNELPAMFSSLRVVYYRENGFIGDCRLGLRNEARFIGQKIA
jgi:2-polyprenyl-3-methyl-5-hydroxy-6-metoxy-1,4-benzoquinol methylase